MAKASSKDGVIAQFGAPRNSEDLGMRSSSEKKFMEIANLRKTICIPADYAASTQLVRHPRKNSFGSGNYIDPLVFRAVEAEGAELLIPGAKYDIRFFAVSNKASSNEGLKFLEAQRSLHVGVSGLSVIYAELKGAFPLDRWVVALDHRGNLFRDEYGSYRVPMILQPMIAHSSFSLGHFDHPWHGKHVFISVVRIG